MGEQRYDILKKREPIIANMQKDLVVKAIEIEAKQSNIELNEAKINEIWHIIRQKWVDAGMKGLDVIVKGVIAKGVLKGKSKK